MRKLHARHEHPLAMWYLNFNQNFIREDRAQKMMWQRHKRADWISPSKLNDHCTMTESKLAKTQSLWNSIGRHLAISRLLKSITACKSASQKIFWDRFSAIIQCAGRSWDLWRRPVYLPIGTRNRKSHSNCPEAPGQFQLYAFIFSLFGLFQTSWLAFFWFNEGK